MFGSVLSLAPLMVGISVDGSGLEFVHACNPSFLGLSPSQILATPSSVFVLSDKDISFKEHICLSASPSCGGYSDPIVETLVQLNLGGETSWQAKLECKKKLLEIIVDGFFSPRKETLGEGRVEAFKGAMGGPPSNKKEENTC